MTIISRNYYKVFMSYNGRFMTWFWSGSVSLAEKSGNVYGKDYFQSWFPPKHLKEKITFLSLQEKN